MGRSGKCLCGHLRYSISADLAPVFNCHCSFCRRVHGAPFTTVGFLTASAFKWHASSGKPSHFVTPIGHHRYFCDRCSTPIFNLAYSIGVGCIIVASIVGDENQPAPWAHVNVESKSPHYEIGDALPSFESWPTREQLNQLAHLHGATLPQRLVSAVGAEMESIEPRGEGAAS